MRRSDRNLSISLSLPVTTISTPRPQLSTYPDRLCFMAVRYTNGRKPTPCTIPRIRILVVWFISMGWVRGWNLWARPRFDSVQRKRQSFQPTQFSIFRSRILLKWATLSETRVKFPVCAIDAIKMSASPMVFPFRLNSA